MGRLEDMPDVKEIVVLVTVSGEEIGRRIADALLTARVAACVNAISGMQSDFWWEGKVESARETLLIIKTKAALLEEVTRLVKANHNYEVPEVIALPIIGGNRDYLDWIAQETAHAQDQGH